MPVFTAGGGSVGSAQINDGAIVNADINAAAAIDLSKLATRPLGLLLDETYADTDSQIDVTAFTACNYLRIHYQMNCPGTSNPLLLRLNNDTGANYTWAYILSSDVPNTGSGATSMSLIANSVTGFARGIIEIFNVAAMQKFIKHSGQIGTAHYEGSCIWNNTTDQVTTLDFIHAGNFASGNRVQIYGAN